MRSRLDIRRFDRERLAAYLVRATWTEFVNAHPYPRGPYYVRFVDGSAVWAEYAGSGQWYTAEVMARIRELHSWTESRPTWGTQERIRSHGV